MGYARFLPVAVLISAYSLKLRGNITDANFA